MATIADYEVLLLDEIIASLGQKNLRTSYEHRTQYSKTRQQSVLGNNAHAMMFYAH